MRRMRRSGPADGPELSDVHLPLPLPGATWPLRVAATAHVHGACRGMSHRAGGSQSHTTTLPCHCHSFMSAWDRRDRVCPHGEVWAKPLTVACTTGWEQKGSFQGQELTGVSSAAFTSHSMNKTNSIVKKRISMVCHDSPSSEPNCD